MNALKHPPEGVTVSETLGEVTITLPRPPARAPLLADTLKLVALAGLAVAFYQQLSFAESYAEMLRFVLELTTAIPVVGDIAARFASEPTLLWLLTGVVAFSMFTSLHEVGEQLATRLSQGVGATLWPRAAPTVHLTSHKLILDGEPTALHDLKRPQDAAKLGTLLDGQDAAVRDWVVELITEARLRAQAGSPADIPPELDALRQRRAAAADHAAQAKQRHEQGG